MDWLSDKELIELTQRKRPSAQLRQLESLGLMDRVRFRTDGSFVVFRPATEQADKPNKTYKLDFSGLKNGTEAA